MGFVAPDATLVYREFQVPVGQVAVIRCVDAFLSGSTAVVALGVNELGTWWRQTAPAASSNFHWEGRQVLNAGEHLNGLIVGSSGTLLVSGYLLDA